MPLRVFVIFIIVSFLAFRVGAQNLQFNLSSATAAIVASAEDRELARRLAEVLKEVSGEDISVIADADVEDSTWRTRDLIVLGNLGTNAVSARLYAEELSFIDSLFPGGEGYCIKTVEDPFGHGRHAIVVGGSTPAGTARAVEAFAALCRAHGRILPRLHAIESGLVDIPLIPDDQMESRTKEDRAYFWEGGAGSLALRRAVEYAQNYYFTNDPRWLRLYKGVILYYIDQAREHDDNWAFSPGMSFYFVLGPLIASWNLIEGSEAFDDAEREKIRAAFLDMSRHMSTVGYLTPVGSPEGEPRQNHPTFAALGLDAAIRYFGRRGNTEVAGWKAMVERTLRGQARTYRADDDGAGFYTYYAPMHAFHYLMKHDPRAALRPGIMGRLGDLVVITTDNRRDPASYGDVRSYAPVRGPHWPRFSGPVLSVAWFAGRDPAHAWAYRWLVGANPPPGIQWAVNTPTYSVPMPEPAAPPRRLMGIAPLILDEAPLEWVASRVLDQAWLPRRERQYVDKISLRSSFDPQDEYLLLDGTAAFAHGHDDANALSRLTWLDRIWLADLDYIRAMPRYHSSVEVARDGRTGIIPPLASMRAMADFKSVGLLTTELADYGGADWRRHILWRKRGWFVVLDQLAARSPGLFNLTCRWRVLGDARLDGRSLDLAQPGTRFRISNADPSAISVHASVARQEDWSQYEHAPNPPHVLEQRQRIALASGQDAFFANLLAARPAEGAAMPRLARLDEGLFVVRDGDGMALVGAGGRRDAGAFSIESELFIADAGGLAAAGLTAFRTAGARLSSDQPVSLSTAEGLLRVARPTRLTAVGNCEINGVESLREGEARIYTLAPGDYRLRFELPTAWDDLLAAAAADATLPPLPAAESPVPFGLRTVNDYSLGSPARVLEPDGATSPAHWIGLADGRILRVDVGAGAAVEVARMPGAIRALHLPAAGGGSGPIVAGDDTALIAGFDRSGRERWRRQLTTHWSRLEKIVNIVSLPTPAGPKIVASTEGSSLLCLDPLTGEEAWNGSFSYHAATTLAVADLDGDGRPEVISGNEYHSPINVYNDSGERLWFAWEQVGSESRSTTPYLGTDAMSLAVGPLRPGAPPLIVIGNENDEIVAAARDGKSVHWRANAGGEVRAMATLDLDGDGALEVIAATGSGQVVAFDADGSRLWWREVGPPLTALVAVDTSPAAGAPLIAYGADDGRVGLLDARGDHVALAYADGAVNRLLAEDASSGRWLVATEAGHLLRLEWRPPRSAFPPQARTSRHHY